MDQYLLHFLQKYLEEIKACADYVKDLNTSEYEEIKEDYSVVISDLQFLLENVKTIEDLAEMDEEEIENVYEYLDEYASNFIISNSMEQKIKDREEYNKLEELLSLFFDEDEENDEE